MTFAEEDVTTRPPAEAAADARAVAALLAEGSGDITDDLLARLERGAADPYFASALTRALTPEQMGRFVVAVGQRRTAMTTSTALMTSDDPLLTEFDARYTRFLDALGGTVGTASRGTGELAPAPDAAQRWVSVITADDQENPRATGVGSAASLVLSHAVLETRFPRRPPS